jgi:FixJ family two-component response regulator
MLESYQTFNQQEKVSTMGENRIMIYVIDDEKSVRRAIHLLLRSAGFTVQTFASAEEFLESSSPIDKAVLILDMRMPGMTGLDLMEKIASRKSGIKIIAITGFDDEITRERARQLGAVAFFRKPVDDQALIDTIKWTRREAGYPNG